MKKIFFVWIVLFVFLSSKGFAKDSAVNVPASERIIQTGVSESLENVQAEAPSLNHEKEKKKQALKKDLISERKKFNQLSKPTPRIYKVTMRNNVVYRLQTALGYVSTIDLPESALKVFVGDQELFKVGVYEKEVLIKPITDDRKARTNLTIVTESSRLSFDVTVGSPETADFVLDFRMPQDDVFIENAFTKAVEEKTKEIEKTYQEKEKSVQKKAVQTAREELVKEVAKGTEVVELRESDEIDRVRLELLSVSRIGDKGYLRFSIRNDSKTNYAISKAVAGFLPYHRKTLGLLKESEGLIELSSELQMEKMAAQGRTVYGVLIFEPRAKGKNEEPAFLLFEDNGSRHFKIKNFKWVD